MPLSYFPPCARRVKQAVQTTNIGGCGLRHLTCPSPSLFIYILDRCVYFATSGSIIPPYKVPKTYQSYIYRRCIKSLKIEKKATNGLASFLRPVSI